MKIKENYMSQLTKKDYDNIASRLEIEIVSVVLAHPPMLADVLQRISNYINSARRVTITCGEAQRDGSITYIVFIEYITGGTLTVGALRRSINEPTEFHS
jgi:hypothetical protein